MPVNTDWKPDIAKVFILSYLVSKSKPTKQEAISSLYTSDAIALLFALITI